MTQLPGTICFAYGAALSVVKVYAELLRAQSAQIECAADIALKCLFRHLNIRSAAPHAARSEMFLNNTKSIPKRFPRTFAAVSA